MVPKEPLTEAKALVAKVSHIKTLLTHSTPTLTSTPSREAPLPNSISPNPLHVLRDASLLLKAQTTKLGLFLINDPFTPTAVQKVLLQCEGECLPGIMGAVDLCHPRMWGNVMVKEVKTRVGVVVAAFSEVLDDIIKKAQGEQLASDAQRIKDKTLASTGQVWEACDALIELEKLGLVGLVVKKVENFRGMLKDAIEELKEWGEDCEDQDEGFVGSDHEDRNSVEDMFSAANKLPTHREDLKDALTETLRRLKLVDMLFQALLKRRIKGFPYKPPTWDGAEAGTLIEDNLYKLDELVVILKRIPEGVDDLANGFYELDIEDVHAVLGRVCDEAEKAATLVTGAWDSKEDEFTNWERKWRDAMAAKPKETAHAKRES